MREPVAEVVGYSIREALGRPVVGVVVTCPNDGCRERRQPATHSHGWTSRTRNGGTRAAHCGTPAAHAYRLRWPKGGPPADVLAALDRMEKL